MSWLKRWLNRPSDNEPPEEPQSSTSIGAGTGTEAENEPSPHIRDAERRRLRRLLQRRDDLNYDLQAAYAALESDNRWTERIDQLDAAIEQANHDLELLKPDPDRPPRPQLPAYPVEMTHFRASDPVEIALTIDDVELRYREEPDWAERGHQVMLPELYRVEGNVDPLLPNDVDENVRTEMREHLLHATATLANDILERQIDNEPLPEVTLADLTRPCSECGGWLDHKDRCPACTGIRWQRQQIQADRRRLEKEQRDVIEDLERFRDRLPVIQRQVQETEKDIAQLENKGVEPA